MENDVNMMNKVICDEIFGFFAGYYGTRTPRSADGTRERRNKHTRHNRELKRLRKAKVRAMREMRQAQRERKPVEVTRSLKGTYLKTTRAYNKALKRSRRAGNEHVATNTRKECATSFWKFASKILDSKASSDAHPTFSVEDAERFFSDTYNPSPKRFSWPPWLPTPTEPKDHFDCDPIRPDEVILVIKHAKASSSPSPFNAIPYRILKRCPALTNPLVELYNHCWEASVVLDA